MGGFAWVTLATNDSYSLGALVLAHSLKRVKTAHQLAILITPGVTEAMRTQLSAVFNVVKEVDVLDSRDTANLALLARPELGITFTKLHCWRLSQYDKCVFLDADTLVLQNCDELFNREELSAAPDVGWPDCFNSGVFVFKPSEETFKAISDFALVHGTFDGGDQGLLNLYFSDWATKDIKKHLPFVYNVVSCVTYSYLPALKQFRDKLKIIHFIGATKPWLQPFDTETGLSRVSADTLAQSQSDFIQLWWNIFCTSVHPSLSANMSDHRLSYVLPTRASTSSTNFFSSSSSPPSPSSFAPSSSLLYSRTVADRSLPPLFSNHTSTTDNHTTNSTGHYYFTDPWEAGNQETGHNTQSLSNFNHNVQHTSGQWTENEQHHNTSYQHENKQTHNDERRDYQAPLSDVSNTYHHDSHQHDHKKHDNHHQHDHENYDNNHQERHNVQNYYLQMNRSRVDSFIQNSAQTFHKEASSFHKEDNSLSSLSHHTKLYPSHSASSTPFHSPPPPLPSPSPSSPHLADAHSIQNEEFVAEANADENNEAGLAGALATVKLGSPLSEEQHALQDHLRRQGWEEGHVDYMGRDSFDNIWAKICETLSTGPSPVQATADVPQQDASKPAETQASARATPPPQKEVRVEARRTSVPKAEKALETLFMKPNTMLQPTSEQADPLTPPPFLAQPQFTPAAPAESKTDDAKLAESAACPLPPKAESESPACPLPPKLQPESPACPLPPKAESESPACPLPPKPQPESPACPLPPKPQPESPACPLPTKPQPESPACPLPPKPQPESPACPLPPKPQPESPACPLPPKPESTLPIQPAEPLSCPLPKAAESAEAPACPLQKPAAEVASEPLACPMKPDELVAPPTEQSCPKPVAPQDACPVPPPQASAPVESVPAAAPVNEPSSVKIPEAAPPAVVKSEAAPASHPALPETPPQSPPQQQETPVQPKPETPKTPVQPQPETPVQPQPETPVQPQPETPKTPVQSQPSTPTITTATPPLSPPPVPSEPHVSATEKLNVQADIPQTPPVVDTPPAAAASQVAPQASAASAPSDEPPIPPKRKGGRGGGDQGKQGRGGKGGRGKK